MAETLKLQSNINPTSSATREAIHEHVSKYNSGPLPPVQPLRPHLLRWINVTAPSAVKLIQLQSMAREAADVAENLSPSKDLK